ncbi:MAG: hypothetical protein OT477_17070 [Chloroflexi bacterium]|nr:hypothetical protein [Chloroflexota bacterium]
MTNPKLIITHLIWDDWNVAHIARHDVLPEQVEESISDEHAVFLQPKQNRLMVLGRSGSRLIATILNAQETSGVYYVITARDMAKKERNLYRTQQETKDG